MYYLKDHLFSSWTYLYVDIIKKNVYFNYTF